MAFRQQLKTYVKVGSEIEVTYQGTTFKGEVIHFENSAPQDANVTIEETNGARHIIPISVTLPPVFTILPEDPKKKKTSEKEDEEFEDDDSESDEELEDEEDAGAKGGDSELPVYKNFENKFLIAAAKKKGIKLVDKKGKSKKRSALIAELEAYDKEHFGGKKKK